MKKMVFWIVASLALTLYLFSSFSDPGAKIGQSFQQACQEVRAAQKMESSSYASAFKLYNNAVAKLNNITNKYSSSEIALNLFKNQLKIGPYPFLEFKEEIFPRAKLRADAENNPLDCSLYAVNLLDTIQYEDKLKLMKAAKLAEISIQYSKQWRFQKAASVLAEGRATVQTIFSDLFKVNSLAEMAQILGTAGKKKDALQLLYQTETIVKNMIQNEKPEALLKIISAYCLIDELESAEKLLVHLKTTSRNDAWAMISQSYATKGNLKSALKNIENIEDDILQAETFRVIINEYAANGKYEKAEELVGNIAPPNIDWKTKALADIAFNAGKEGETDLAVTYFEQAIKTANQFESHELTQKLSTLNYIAFRFIELQDNKNAIQLLESNSALAKNMSEFNRAEAFAEIAVAYGQIGESEKSIQLIENYIPDYLTIDIRGNTLARLALQFATKRQYSQALELANQINEETTLLVVNRASVLSRIAISAASASDYQTALQIAQEIDSYFYRPWTFGEIALQIPHIRLRFHKRTEIKQYLHQIITELEPKQNHNKVSQITPI